MKYFAKYLPVEGEIKEDDLHINKLTGNIEKASKNVAINWANNMSYNDGKRFLRDDYKLVKLFLCSRDIHFGRGIHWMGKLEVEYGSMSRNKDGGKINLYMADDPKSIHSVSPAETDCFQIIGEISPEATWVKEGDEFEEKDIHTGWFIDGKLCYTIKGPCGHFH